MPLLVQPLSVNDLRDTSPQQSHGTSYTLKETTSRGEDQSSQELIEELDKGSHHPSCYILSLTRDYRL